MIFLIRRKIIKIMQRTILILVLIIPVLMAPFFAKAAGSNDFYDNSHIPKKMVSHQQVKINSDKAKTNIRSTKGNIIKSMNQPGRTL